MRHRKSGRKFNRDSANRKAMFRNLAISLIEHEIIKTTLPKAKELRGFVERLITIAKKDDSVAARRLVYSRLGNRSAVTKLFAMAGKYTDRPGGYTRVLKFGNRVGDAAPMAIIELVEREQQQAV